MYSFFIQIGNIKLVEKDQISSNLFLNNDIRWIEEQETLIGIPFLSKNHLIHNHIHYFLIGKIDNLSAIAIQNNVIPTISDIEICVQLYCKNGWEFIKKLKGYFAFIINDNSKKEIQISIGNTGLMQGYWIKENQQFFITSELKAFCNTETISRKMIPLESYNYGYTKKVDPEFCFLQNIKRIKPGFVYSFNYFDINNIRNTQLEMFPIRAKNSTITKEDAKEITYKLLQENILDKTAETPVGIPISGGLDSGLIASLLHQQHKKIFTYTVGTPFGNEFDNAYEVHEFVQSLHKEINLNKEDFWEGFLASVWKNEICDPLYAEGFVSFYHVFKHAQMDTKQIFTGYGADLILGDFLLIKDKSSINTFSEYWCKRVAWTGEMSPYLAQSFGIEIQHPFWEYELIDFSLSIPYAYKYIKDEVKAILREFAVEKKILPNNIAWRKKNALTTGTNIDQLFSHCLEIPYQKDYSFKSIFLYYLFEAFFVLDKKINEIDIQSIIHKTQQYVGK